MRPLHGRDVKPVPGRWTWLVISSAIFLRLLNVRQGASREVLEVGLQVLAVVPPRLAVYAGGCVSLGSEVRQAQAVDVVHVVQERCEPLFPILSCCFDRRTDFPDTKGMPFIEGKMAPERPPDIGVAVLSLPKHEAPMTARGFLGFQAGPPLAHSVHSNDGNRDQPFKGKGLLHATNRRSTQDGPQNVYLGADPPVQSQLRSLWLAGRQASQRRNAQEDRPARSR